MRLFKIGGKTFCFIFKKHLLAVLTDSILSKHAFSFPAHFVLEGNWRQAPLVPTRPEPLCAELRAPGPLA